MLVSCNQESRRSTTAKMIYSLLCFRTLLCFSSSLSSIFLAFTDAVCALAFPPAPYFLSVCTMPIAFIRLTPAADLGTCGNIRITLEVRRK